MNRIPTCSRLLALVLLCAPLHAQERMTEIKITLVDSMSGLTYVDVKHNGTIRTDGAGLVTVWVNGFSGVCEPGSQSVTVVVRGAAIDIFPPPGQSTITLKAHQAGTNVTLTRKYSYAELKDVWVQYPHSKSVHRE
jgi:hypothetical protein